MLTFESAFFLVFALRVGSKQFRIGSWLGVEVESEKVGRGKEYEMKRILLGIAVSLMDLPMLASAALYEGSEAKACFAQHADPTQQVSCLQRKKKESELQLEKIIIEKNKQIKSSNVGLFNGKEDATETAGEVYSQRFLHAQKLWKQYRKELCLAVVTEINEDAYDYQVFIDQCEINLNKRHSEEIKMVGILPAS